MLLLHRVLLAFGLIIAIGAVQSATTVANVRSLSAGLDQATAVPIARVDAAWRVEDAFRRSSTFLTSVLDGIHDQTDDDAIARFQALSAPIESGLARALVGAPPASAGLVRAIAQWKAAALVLLGETKATSIPTPHAMEMRETAIQSGLQAMIADALHQADEARASIESKAWWTKTLAIAFALVATLIGIGIAVPFALSLTRPLRRVKDRMRTMMDGDLASAIEDDRRGDEIGQIAAALHFVRDSLIARKRMEGDMAAIQDRAAAERLRETEEIYANAARDQTHVVRLIGRGLDAIAKGDLTIRINEGVSGEYEKLRTDFNATAASLEDALQTIAKATEAIGAKTDQIAQASDDLSRRTEHQAANLEETAATLSHITDTVKKTASGAGEAAGVVAKTRDAAESSGLVVQEAVEAMGHIKSSSSQIGQIIGVIDEIAFQTNLLALNAGVEAARAGEAGRGFAVVASEVRALAQRSAEAAKEIKALISASSTQVESGVVLVGRTGAALKNIIQQVLAVDSLVRDISASSQEQAVGLAEVNIAVNQMDQVVQQNAAMVQESTAAAHALKHETRDLSSMVSRFTINGAARARVNPVHAAQAKVAAYARR